MPDSQSLYKLRQALTLARDAIQADQRQQFETLAIQFLTDWDQLPQFKTIACYYSIKGEFPTAALIERLLSLGKKVYLPILRSDKKNYLAFQQIIPKQSLKSNRYGIPEPVFNSQLQINAKDLDLVILPLLGFDDAGNRLGMGGGYYDRTFAFTKDQHNKRHPYLLGLAFSHQQSDQIIAQPWDVPLDSMLTENGFS